MEQNTVKSRLLYIEDEVESCRTMIEFLSPRGITVIVSFAAEEAYDLLKKWNPGLILIDLKLIGLSGVDFIEKIQKEGITTPIIVITAYPRKIAQIELKGLTIYCYYEKPYSYADLYETVKKVLGGKKT